MTLQRYTSVQYWNEQYQALLEVLPELLACVLILTFTYFAGRVVSHCSERITEHRVKSQLIRAFFAKLVRTLFTLFGVYLVMRILGLTQLAATILGGTGVLGLIIGIAFKDITENFLASMLISLQRPFGIGDLISVENYMGFVQAVTTRGTIILTLEGNHVQIPNAIVYKASVTNYTANPLSRIDFMIGIGFDSSISRAQEVATDVLLRLPAVKKEPEPMVVVESLGSSTINIRIYFWIDSVEHSLYKAKSAGIEAVAEAFIAAGISMPDDAREVVFPKGIDVRTGTLHASGEGVKREGDASSQSLQEGRNTPSSEYNSSFHQAVERVKAKDLRSEASEVKDQGKNAKLLGQDQSLV